MDKQVHSIASDFLRIRMIHYAVRKAADLAGDNFYYGLGITEVGDEELAFFAEDAWGPIRSLSVLTIRATVIPSSFRPISKRITSMNESCQTVFIQVCQCSPQSSRSK